MCVVVPRTGGIHRMLGVLRGLRRQEGCFQACIPADVGASAACCTSWSGVLCSMLHRLPVVVGHYSTGQDDTDIANRMQISSVISAHAG
jgi:hypothetical protein